MGLGKIKREILRGKKENTAYQNLWNVAKAVLKEMFIAVNAYIFFKITISKKKKLTLYLKKLENNKLNKTTVEKITKTRHK